jgi:hypothetical protein
VADATVGLGRAGSGVVAVIVVAGVASDRAVVAAESAQPASSATRAISQTDRQRPTTQCHPPIAVASSLVTAPDPSLAFSRLASTGAHRPVGPL